MANLKNITDLPVVESAEGLNLIVNDSGSAKQIAASAVGAQADWAVTDESNPAFIKNKPVEEWDLDLTVDITWNTETSALNAPVFTANDSYSYDAFVAKIEAGDIPKVKFRFNQALDADNVATVMDGHCNIITQSGVYYIFVFMGGDMPIGVILNPDGTFTMLG